MAARQTSTMLALGAIAVIAATVRVHAAELSAADGAALAELRCGRCHATGPKGDSPQRGVIPFWRLHERYPVDMLVEAQRTGSIAGHDEMPMFDLPAEEVRALLRHIDSLAPGRPGYLDRVPAAR